jgi:hypothetical protein
MGFHYANAEALNNIDMINWEIDRINQLLGRGEVSLEALIEDTEAIQNEIELVLRIQGLKKDERRKLENYRENLQVLNILE